MSGNPGYNTRKSGRYNVPGQFVPASEPTNNVVLGQRATARNAGVVRQQQPAQPQQPQQQYNVAGVKTQPKVEPQEPFQNTDVDMKGAEQQTGETERPHWMKSKLQGVKKISKKERRRRQNQHLRRLLTPKSALMVLNEMLPTQITANQYKVEATQSYYGPQNGTNFCADLNIDGKIYKGFGENKMAARSAAAEQAIRDIIIQKMSKETDASAMETSEEGADEEQPALPMMQLASYALHKLFAEWEYEGHKVPQMRHAANSICGSEASAPAATPTPAAKPSAPAAKPVAPSAKPNAPSAKPRAVKPPRELPAAASTMHPCMLLTYMRPGLQYQELGFTGDRPQNYIYTVGLEVDGTSYTGTASSKKEARRQAATQACFAIWGVTFDQTPAGQPIPVATS